MRTFHTGGVATGSLIENDIKAVAGGTVQHHDINAVQVTDADGNKRLVALKRNGEIAIVDAKGRELEKYKVPYGSTVLVADGEKVKAAPAAGGVGCRTSRRSWPKRAASSATRTSKKAKPSAWKRERKGGGGEAKLVVIEHKGERHPRITIEGDDGKILDFHYLPAKARIEVTQRPEDRRRPDARPPAARSGRHDGHHRRSAPRHGNLRGPQAQGPVRAGGNLRHGRNPLRKAPRQDDHHRPVRNRHGTRAPRPAGQGTAGPRRRLRRGRRSAHPRADHSARHPSHQGRGVALSVPAGRGAERLSQPGREDQRQAHRDHPQPDAAQGEGRRRRRHQVPARRGGGQLPLPPGQRCWSARA